MFHEMRRGNQLLSREDTLAVLQRGSSGVLAVHGDDGYPYAVPLSYVFENGKIYFHCAYEGHKIDAIRADDKVSFCVVDQDEVVSEKYTTFFRSVIAFGRAAIVESADEKRSALMALACKYSADQPIERHHREVEGGLSHTCIVRIDIEQITGKEARELALQNHKKENSHA